MNREIGNPAEPRELCTASTLKLRVWKIVASDAAGRLIGALTAKRIRHHGLWFDTRSKDFTPTVRAQMFWGGYESAETRMIHNFLQDSSTVIELGSSLGITAAHIAAVMHHGDRLICVEANPRLLPGLRTRLSRAAANLRVDVIHAAVTEHCGTTTLTIAPQTVSSRLTATPRPQEPTVSVPAITLKEILRLTGVTEFDLVSDIEGSEAYFMLQDTDALSTCRRAVIELHDTTLRGRTVSVFDLMNAATTAGFKTVSRHGPVIALARP
jgi:FkbM family methyltransferase